MMSWNAQLPSWYEYRLVALSALVAAFSSYAAFDAAGRMIAAPRYMRWIWWAAGTTALAFGIWSMHYTGMLAFRVPVPLAYDWPTAVLSFLPGFAGSAAALYLLNAQNLSLGRIWTAAIASGCGISGVHYISMISMRMSAAPRYDLPIVILSFLVAIVGSGIALSLAFHFANDGTGSPWRKMLGALVMGAVAISGMHYTNMAAVKYVPSPAQPDLSHAVSISFLGTFGLAIVTLLVQALAVLTCNADRRFHDQREISARILQSQDEERGRIARQLHETVAQTLAALRMSLGKARHSGPAQSPGAMAAIDESISLADESMKEIRTVSYLLQPPLLEEDGLGSALRWFVSGFQERSGIIVTLDAPLEMERFSQETEMAVFRIVQECLTNIHRHSGSPTATIHIRLDGEKLILEVEDAGRGMPSGVAGKKPRSFPIIGVGIASMQERVQKLGGNLDICSSERGTRVSVTLPPPRRA